MAAIQIEQLRSSVRGAIIQPGDETFESARQVYNGMIDRRPALIVRCTDVADVIAAVDYARTNQLLTAVRGGGHNGGGLGTCEGGLVIDLSAMKGVRVDRTAQTVRVAGGCLWGDVDHATHPFGLAVPSGFISTTGVGGLTLGGGIGYLTRAYGLTIDNLLSADVVLADGSVVTADEGSHSDLFWALRGGGGNFGVVTSFEFRAHPVRTLYAGPTFWPLDQTTEVMAAYRDFILAAPEDVNGFFAFLDDSSVADVPGAAAPQESVRRHVGVHRVGETSRGRDQADANDRQAAARSPGRDAAACGEQPVRRALSTGAPVVLEGGFREGAE